MNPAVKWAKQKAATIIGNFVKDEVQRTLESTMEWMLPQMIEYINSPKESRQSYYDHTNDPISNLKIYSSLKERLLAFGIPVEEAKIDIADFEHWLDKFTELKKHYSSWGKVQLEKCLEHYLAFRYLNISRSDLYIDIAAQSSPWAYILNKKGYKVYRLDQAYQAGIHGINIGADVSNTKLPDGFCSVMSAQCAFEAFQGEADIGFVKEAARILDKRGHYGIVPLYLDDTYFVSVTPYVDLSKIKIENEAKRVWRDDEHKAPFSRIYSPESFKKRIYANLPENMIGKVLYFKNVTEVMERHDGQLIYCFFMFYCQKRY